MEVSVPKEWAGIGDRVRIKMEGDTQEGIVIPEAAIMTKYLVPTVFTVENGKAVSKTVKVLARGNGKVLVEGLPIGTKIVTAGKDRVTEGQIVE